LRSSPLAGEANDHLIWFLKYITSNKRKSTVVTTVWSYCRECRNVLKEVVTAAMHWRRPSRSRWSCLADCVPYDIYFPFPTMYNRWAFGRGNLFVNKIDVHNRESPTPVSAWWDYLPRPPSISSLFFYLIKLLFSIRACLSEPRQTFW